MILKKSSFSSKKYSDVAKINILNLIQLSPESTLSRKTEAAILIMLVIAQIACLILLAHGKLIVFVGALAVLSLFIFSVFSVTKIYFLLATYIAALPMIEYAGNFPGLGIAFTWKIGYPLFALLTAYWLIYLLKSSDKCRLNQMDIAVIIYLAAMFLAAINGIFQGYTTRTLLYDFMPASFFLGYFIFLYSPLRNRIKQYYDLMLIAAVFVSLQYIYAVAQTRSIFALFRIVSEHIHIAQLAVPYIIATLIYSKSRKRKFVFSMLLPLTILGIIICQQRSFYAATVITILSLAGLFLYTRRQWIRSNLSKFYISAIIAISSVAVFLIVAQVASDGKFLVTLYSRFFIFLNLNRLSADVSWQGRWQEVRSALRGLEHFWLFGKGFGVSQITRFRFVEQIVLDQSYMYYIWKTGFVGLFSALFMYFTFFRRCISTLRKNVDANDRIFLVAALFNTAGMMLIAFANVSIGHFRLMFVWAGLFACVEAIARKYD